MKRKHGCSQVQQWTLSFLLTLVLCFGIGLNLSLLPSHAEAEEIIVKKCYSDADCQDGNVCTTNTCESGVCKSANNNKPCDDGYFCNGTDTCSDGSCSVHSGNPCSSGDECNDQCNEEMNNCFVSRGTKCTYDGNPCTDNECNGEGKCEAFNNMANCSDDNPCTIGDMCGGGQCLPGNLKDCSDGIECTIDSCNENTGQCVSDNRGCNCSEDADCNDHNVCTDEYCDTQTGKCIFTANNNSCDDGIFCNGQDVCLHGKCVHGGDPCEYGEQCNNVCDEEANNCFKAAKWDPCDSGGYFYYGDSCTTDKCDGWGNCVARFNTDDCKDGNRCTVDDTCGGGACLPGQTVSCDDGIKCTVDKCDPKTGKCIHDYKGCECYSDYDCFDGNICTTNTCDKKTGKCVTTFNEKSCDDGLFCNGQDICDKGQCVHLGDPCANGKECANVCDEEANNCTSGAEGLHCTSDGNVCTDNKCDGSGNCIAINNTDDCDDGNPCTLNDMCGGGQCMAGMKKNCDDYIACTTDSCDESTGECVNDTKGCECTSNADCDDGNPCTSEYCDQNTLSCVRSKLPDHTSCDDGIFCNGIDKCLSGICVHTGDPCDNNVDCQDTCDEATESCNSPQGTQCRSDGNQCTDNICDGNGNCIAVDNTADCDTGDRCIIGFCNDGDCTGVPKNCDDGIACTVDSCDSTTGECIHDNSGCSCEDNADCDDGNPCTRNTCTSSKTCSSEVLVGATCDDGNLCTLSDTCNENGSCVGTPRDCGDDICLVCDPSSGACVTDTDNPECTGEFQEIQGGSATGCSLNPGKESSSGWISLVSLFFLMALPLIASYKRRKNIG